MVQHYIPSCRSAFQVQKCIWDTRPWVFEEAEQGNGRQVPSQSARKDTPKGAVLYARMGPVQSILFSIVDVKNRSSPWSIVSKILDKLQKGDNANTVVGSSRSSGHGIIVCGTESRGEQIKAIKRKLKRTPLTITLHHSSRTPALCLGF